MPNQMIPMIRLFGRDQLTLPMGRSTSMPIMSSLYRIRALRARIRLNLKKCGVLTGDEPNASNANFGSTKKNNTPHEFMINGKRLNVISAQPMVLMPKLFELSIPANNDLSIATMLITRTEMADAIAARNQPALL